MTEYVLKRFINEYKTYNGSLDEFVAIILKEFDI